MFPRRPMRNLVLATLLAAPLLGAQAQSSESPLPIADNSFLVEEAYNQERGIVQHISTFARAHRGEGWLYTFTQEWPLAGQRHQFSYTVPLSRLDGVDGGHRGVGDIALNYRYQIGGGEGSRVAFAPRASLLLPTGASRRSLGAGATGVQVNLPFSAVLPAAIVVHSNAGATVTPRAKNSLDHAATTTNYALGQSVVWLARPKLNLLVEATWARVHEVTGPGRTEPASEALLSPGIRGAIDFRSGLQVVPGIAFPIGIGPSRGERYVFLYLSFEHPYTRNAP